MDDILVASYTPFQAARRRFFASATALARSYAELLSPRMDADSSVDLCDTDGVGCGARPWRGDASVYVILTALVVWQDHGGAAVGRGVERTHAG